MIGVGAERNIATTGKSAAPSSVASVFRHVWLVAVRTDARAAAFVVLIVTLNSAAVTTTALAQRWVVDGTGKGVTIGLAIAAGLAGLVYTVSAAAGRIQSNLRGLLSEHVEDVLTEEILTAVSSVPSIHHLEEPAYLDRLALFRAKVADLAGSCWSSVDMASTFASLGLSLWLLAAVHPALALLALLGIPPLLFARLGQRIVREAVEDNAGRSRQEQLLHDMCIQADPAKEIRIAGSGLFLSEMADRLWAEMSRHENRARIKGAVGQFAGWACFGAGFAAAVVLVAHLVAAGSASLGDIVLVITVATRLRAQIATAVSNVGNVAEARAAAGHYRWLREHAEAQNKGGEPTPSELRHGITMTGVTFRYPGRTEDVLRGIDLELPAGSTVALVGINGAGKSTLVKLLTGMYEPTEGSIAVDGIPLAGLERRGWFAANSGVFQDFTKFETTVREAIGIGDLPRLNDDEAICDAVDRAGAASVIDALPQGIQTQLGRVFGGQELSHGQWQKIALARGLLRGAPLLMVLDEPTSALDPQAEHELFERFVSASRKVGTRFGAVTVLVSHRFSTAHMADLIIVLNDGEIVELGSHMELLRNEGSYAKLYRIQEMSYA